MAPARKPSFASNPRSRLCRFEPLEDRRMLSVLFVDDDAASGGNGLSWGSAFDDLQAALDAATVLNGDGDTGNDVEQIWIAEGVYRPSAELEPGNPRSASFSLVDGVTLYGGFAGTEAALEERAMAEEHETVLSGDIGVVDDVSDNAYTVVYCGEGIESAIDGVTVTAANGKGGVYNYRGTLRVANSRLWKNASNGDGGAIYNDGKNGGKAAVVVENTLISENTAHYSGGGIYSNGRGAGDVTLVVEHSVISENTARDNGGGIYSAGFSEGNARLTIRDSTLADNAAAYGGGVATHGHLGSATATIVGCTISRNKGVSKSDSNSAGGGLLIDSASMTIMDSSIGQNSAHGGGGLYLTGYDGAIVTIFGSVIAGNVASARGGGICLGDMASRNSVLAVDNTTFSGNSSGTKGGAIFVSYGKLNVTNSTVTGNTAQFGSGVYAELDAQATLCNTVVAGNDGGDDIANASLFSGSHNLIGNGTGQTTFVDGENGNLVGTAENPIDPLFVRNPSDGGDGWGDNPDTPDIDESANDDYGDLRILHDSPAVDAGDDALLPVDEFDLDGDGDTAEAIPHDLAGNPRIAGDRVDMGAYESLGMVYDSVIYVDDDATAGGDGTAWTAAFSDVQTALDTAALFNTDGDPANDVQEIWIAEGTYRPSAESNPGNPRSARFALVDGVTLYGGFAGTEAALEERAMAEEHETVLSGDIGVVDDVSDNAYTVVYCGEGIESAIDGVTVTAANGKGGVYNYRGTLRVANSSLWKNASNGDGGAIYNDGRNGGSAVLVVENSVVSENTAYNNGGGIDNDGRSGNATLTVQNSTFTENTALFGGGIYSWGTDGFAAATIIGSTLSGNEAQPRSNGAGGAGGGILNCDGTFVVVDSTIDNNLAKGGGGIHTVSGYTDNAELLIANSTISGNAARGSSLSVNGGGISNLQVSGRVSKVTVVNSAIVGNSAERSGGGVYNDGGQVNLTHTTVTGNFTGHTAGVYSRGNNSDITLKGVIVAYNAGNRDLASSSIPSGSHNLIGNGTGQTTFVNGVDGNLVGTAENPIDPLFVRDPSDGGDGWGDNPDTPDIDESANDDYGDLRILHDSPAVDAGDDALLPADEFDLDGDGDTAEAIPYDLAGNPRIAGDRVDMGAYESLGIVYDSVIYVDDDAPAGGDGTAWTSAFSDVQTALDTAALFNTDGDPANDVQAIWIADGIYRPSAESNPGNPRSARFALVDGVTLYGGFAGTEAALEERALAEEHETVLSGDIGVVDDVSDNAYTVVYCGEGIESTIDGVTVTAANGKGGVYNYRGTLRVSKSRLVNNSSSERGGAIHNDGRRGGEATLIVEDSLISENTARDLGGGICSSGYRGSAQLTVLNTTLVENTASFGGAVYSDGESGFAMTTIVGCTISRNEVVPRPSVAPGGGGLLANSASMTIVDSSINENSARAGGGISITGYDATMITISNSVLSGNSASLHGGGIYFNDLSRGQSVLTIDNTTFSGNSSNSKGGAIFISEGELIVTNATVAGNTAQFGSGILAEWHAKAALYNTLVAGNDGGDDIANASLFSGSYNLIGNGTGQTTFIDGQDGNLVGTAENPIDPLFVRAPSDGGDGWGDDADTPDIDESANDDYGDLRLRADSPAIDAGDNALLPADEFDLDGDGDTAEAIPYDLAGNPRVVGERVDIGAYEYVAAAAIPGDLNGDGTVSGVDLDIVRANWGQPVTPGSLVDGDPSGDGTVGGADLDIVRANWGESLPPAASASTPQGQTKSQPPAAILNSNEMKKADAATAPAESLARRAWLEAIASLYGNKEKNTGPVLRKAADVTFAYIAQMPYLT